MEIAGFLKLSELHAVAVCSRHLVVPHLTLDSYQPTPSAQCPSLALFGYIGERSASRASPSCSDGATPPKQMHTGDSTAAAADASAPPGGGCLSAALADLSVLLESVRVARFEARERATDTPALLVPLRRALLEQKLAALATIRVLLYTVFHFFYLYLIFKLLLYRSILNNVRVIFSSFIYEE